MKSKNVKQIESERLSDIFGTSIHGIQCSTPMPTLSVLKNIELERTIILNKTLEDEDKIHEEYLDEREIKELALWKKLDKEWRLSCSKSFYLIKSSVDTPIWADMKTEFNNLHSEDKESTIKMWNYLIKTFGAKNQMSEQLLIQKAKKLGNFESFKDTDLTLSLYQEICEES